MATKVSFDGETRTINILAGVTYIDVNEDLYSPWKLWVREEDSGFNRRWAPAFRQGGGEPTDASGENYSPSYFYLLNGWVVSIDTGEEVLISVNLATDPDNPAPITQSSNDSRLIIYNSDAQAIKSEIEESLEYRGVIKFNANEGHVGQAYPIGTSAKPVNNLTDLLALSTKYKIDEILLHSDITVDQDIIGFVVKGHNGTEVLTTMNISIVDCSFHDLKLAGTKAGVGQFRANKCFIMPNTQGMSGVFINCGILGDITITNSGVTLFRDCFSVRYNDAAPKIILGDSEDIHPYEVNFRGLHGQIELVNINQPDEFVTIAGYTGSGVIVNESCTDGFIKIAGMSEDSIIDNSMGSTVNVYYSLPSRLAVANIQSQTDKLTFSGDLVYVTLDEVGKQAFRDGFVKALTEGLIPEIGSIDHNINRIDNNTQE